MMVWVVYVLRWDTPSRVRATTTAAIARGAGGSVAVISMGWATVPLCCCDGTV